MVEPAPIEAAQRSIRERVAAEGEALGRLRPPAMIALLAGAALWPIAAPLLGTGAAVGVAGGALGLLSGPGERFVTDFLDRVRRSGRAPPEVEVRGELDRALERAMEDGTALREDMGQLLRSVDGVGIALAAAADDTRRELAAGLAELGGRWTEFAWLLADVQARQYEALALGRQQLDLQREQLIKINRLLAERERRRSPPRAPPRAGRTRASRPGTAPYKGLQRYEAEDAELFFGREELRAELLARIAESRMLVLVGDSGSGKSSLLRAGLVRAIWDGVLPGGADWRVALLTPGARPLDELAARISALCGVTPGALRDELRADPSTLALAARRAVVDAPSGSRLLVVVDQLEELFTMGCDEAGRRTFLDALLCAMDDTTGALTVVLAIRGDFLGRLAEHRGLPEALRDNKVLVGPLADEDLKRAIEGPAAYAGLAVEPELVDLVLSDARDARGALPLVSYALLETFERGSGRTLTVREYVDAGGMRGALAQSADAVLDRLAPAQREIARSVLLRLTSLGEGVDDTRRRASWAELVGDPSRAVAVEAVVDTLVRARLLTSGADGVEIAHEALIRHWPTLRGWLDENRESLRLHHRLRLAAHEWEALGRDPGALYRGAPLAAAVEWLADHGEDASPLERAFVAAARRAERDELDAARRSSRRLRTLAGALAALLLVAVAASVTALRQSERADAQRASAERAARVAESRRLAAAAVAGLRSSVDVPSLLALHAYLRAPTAEARSALVGAIQAAPRLRATLREHGAARVPLVQVTPDGTIVSAGWDGFLRFADLPRLRPSAEPIAVDGTPQGLAVSPDGRWMAVAANERIRLWEQEPGRPPVYRGDRSAGHVLSISIGGRGPMLATGLEDGSVRLYHVPTLRMFGRTAPRPGHAVLAVALRGADEVALGGQGGGGVALWQAASRRFATIDTGGGVVTGMEATPDGNRLAAVEPSGLTLQDRATGRLLHRRAPAGADFTGVALSRDGSRVAAAADDGTIRLFRADDLAPEGPPLRGHEGPVLGLAFGPGARSLVTTGDDGSVRLWDLEDPAGAAVMHASGPTAGGVAALSPEGGAVAVGADGIWFSDAAGKRLPAGPVSSSAARVWQLAVSGDGRRVAAADAEGSVTVWDAAARGPVGREFESGAPEPLIAIDRGGHVLATGAFRGGGPRLWDIGRGTLIERLPADGGGVGALAFSHDGRLLASGGYDGAARLWDLLADSPSGTPMRAGEDMVSALAFSAGGTRLAVASGDAIVLWDVANQRRLGTLPAGPHTVAIAFSPDGHTLAASSGRAIRLWDAPRQRPLGQPLRGHAAAVQAVAFARDGTLVSADSAGAVVRWDPMLADERAADWRDRICSAINRDLTLAQWRELVSGTAYRQACLQTQAARP